LFKAFLAIFAKNSGLGFNNSEFLLPSPNGEGPGVRLFYRPSIILLLL
jgi:hypothetical protein